MNHGNLSENVLNTALQQFIENVNHREKLFIQFFLGVVIVIVGYSIIYTDTKYNAFFWETLREGNFFVITSYSISALIGSYIIAQSVLILLARFILSSGFSFRKYQTVIYKIRKAGLGNDFKNFFGDGTKAFSPYDKSGCFSSNSYLPEFETIFFVFIWGLQIVLFFSIIFKLGVFLHPIFRKIVEPRVILNISGTKIFIVRFWVILLAFCPLFLTCYFQFRYYSKYLEKIFNPHSEMLQDGGANPDFKKFEGLRKYKRKNSLTLGYLLLFYLFNGLLNIFLILFLTTKNLFLEKWEVLSLLIISLFIFLCFMYNNIQSYLKLSEFDSRINTKMIGKKAFKEFKIQINSIVFKRSKWAKHYGIFSYAYLMLLFVLIFLSCVLIYFCKEYRPFFWYYSSTYILITVLIFFIGKARKKNNAKLQKH